MKQRIILEHDGAVKKAIIFDNKSYVLLGHDDKVTLKGNTLRGRSNEKFVNKFIRTCVDHVFNENFQLIHEEYVTLRTRIMNKEMTVDQVSKRESLNMTLEEYRNKQSAGNNPISTYEAALTADRHYAKGDAIVTWVEEPETIIKTYKNKPDKEIIPKTSSYELVRLAENFNGNIYVDHYLNRLDLTCKKFLIVLGVERFKDYFPDISILKTDRRKLIPTMDVMDFIEAFPDHGWTSKCMEKVTQTQKKNLTIAKELRILSEDIEKLI